MMKNILYFLFLFLAPAVAMGQSVLAPDTLLTENFEIDPSQEMISQPDGDDIFWVNWDEDRKKTNCGFGNSAADTLSPWYWDYDLGADVITSNNAYTSCSFGSKSFRSRNWLITPPIYVADSNYVLSWKSSAFQGPFLTDGYHVLLSEKSNFPMDFTDTLFSAAETATPFSTSQSLGFPLEVSAYKFSPGYLQANSYTNSLYYTLVKTDFPNGFYQGKLEPHALGLKKYQGKTVYIAFLHDSFDDFLLQLDDIVVAHSTTSSAHQQPDPSGHVEIWPSIVHQQAQIRWSQIPESSTLTLQIFRLDGNLVTEFREIPATRGQFDFNMADAVPGAYFAVLLNSASLSQVRFTKL